MRKFACFLLLLCGAATLPAADTWRWRDADGVVHFSDVPVPGAELIRLGSAPKPGTVATPARPASNPTASGTANGGNESQIVPYARCVLLAPVNDQVLLNETFVQVAFDLQPALQGSHEIQVLLNGTRSPDWPSTSIQGSLAVQERGSYTLVARVVDDFGRDLCTSPQVLFHVRLPTVPNGVVRPIRPIPR
ncbi:MAG: hypothetical protein RL030_1269 [Pseudomonadota bacterium]|jgi:hypothetical protein